MRVLVIDDDPLVCKAVWLYIRSHYDVVWAFTPDDAIEAILLGRFDLVITDFELGPDRSGKLVTAMDLPLEFDGLPFVLMSADTGAIPAAFRERALATLEKPFGRSDLLELLGQVEFRR